MAHKTFSQRPAAERGPFVEWIHAEVTGDLNGRWDAATWTARSTESPSLGLLSSPFIVKFPTGGRLRRFSRLRQLTVPDEEDEDESIA